MNDGERFRAGERISSGFVESAINQIVAKRFSKRQLMRWTGRGAHLTLQTRTGVLSDSFQARSDAGPGSVRRGQNEAPLPCRPRSPGCPHFVMPSLLPGSGDQSGLIGDELRSGFRFARLSGRSRHLRLGIAGRLGLPVVLFEPGLQPVADALVGADAHRHSRHSRSSVD